MSKRQILALLGVWVMVFLFLGFTKDVQEWIAIITGILIIFVAYRKVQRIKPTPNSAFVQNNAVEDVTDTHVAPSEEKKGDVSPVA